MQPDRLVDRKSVNAKASHHANPRMGMVTVTCDGATAATQTAIG